MPHIVLINPRTEPSYWGMELALPFFGKKANFPPACLPLLAALTPSDFRVTLIDENVESIDYDAVTKADMVGVTGMSVHRFRMREILTELKRRNAFTVVGGPWVTVQEDYFGDLADVIFIGEAEETWPTFLTEWKLGRHQHRYEQAQKTDMSQVPIPRFDLLNMRNYMFGTLQFSRGCPFQCEFCDIIVTFGRRPRLKTGVQVIAELEAMRAQKVEIAFIVDDNLIGNKKAIKEVLKEVIAWQQAEGYPMTFFTEASLDLAEDPELMRLMVAAKFMGVFVGIESPNEAALLETKKLQNVRKGSTILGRVHTIQDAGLEVMCGMIMGFDNDDPSVFNAQREFLRQAHIPNAVISMLYAIPKTPLYDRLRREGRLDTDDKPAFGTNVIPLRMSREALRDGYLQVFKDLYEPEAFFGRLDELFLKRKAPFLSAARDYWRKHPWRRFKVLMKDVIRSAGLFARLMWRVPQTALRQEYRRRLAGVIRKRPDPHLVFLYTIKCAMHYHHWALARQVECGDVKQVNTF